MYTFLQEVNKVLAPFNFPSSVGSQVMHLMRMIEGKTKALDSVLKELELLLIKNVFLNQNLKECAYLSLMEVTWSFENALQKVEHFHCPLIVLREKIRPT